MRHRTIALAAGLMTSLFSLACNESTNPDREDVAGSYTATAFTTTTGGVTTNQLDAGASIVLVLTASGSTTGTLFIPEGDDDGSDLTQNLAGSWSLDDDEVTFDHTADTFIRDMPFTVVGNTLVGDRTFGSTRVQLTLTRP